MTTKSNGAQSSHLVCDKVHLLKSLFHVLNTALWKSLNDSYWEKGKTIPFWLTNRDLKLAGYAVDKDWSCYILLNDVWMRHLINLLKALETVDEGGSQNVGLLRSGIDGGRCVLLLLRCSFLFESQSSRAPFVSVRRHGRWSKELCDSTANSRLKRSRHFSDEQIDNFVAHFDCASFSL